MDRCDAEGGVLNVLQAGFMMCRLGNRKKSMSRAHNTRLSNDIDATNQGFLFITAMSLVSSMS